MLRFIPHPFELVWVTLHYIKIMWATTRLKKHSPKRGAMASISRLVWDGIDRIPRWHLLCFTGLSDTPSPKVKALFGVWHRGHVRLLCARQGPPRA